MYIYFSNLHFILVLLWISPFHTALRPTSPPDQSILTSHFYFSTYVFSHLLLYSINTIKRMTGSITQRSATCGGGSQNKVHPAHVSMRDETPLTRH